MAMADLRKALKDAGVVSEKELRQARHADRVRRKELGEEGLEAQREHREAELRVEQAERKRADAEGQRRLRAEQEAAGRAARLAALLRAQDLAAREAGSARYYFTMPGGEIAYVEVGDGLSRRLAQGDAAIVDGRGLLDREFGIIPGKAAAELDGIARERIIVWHAHG